MDLEAHCEIHRDAFVREPAWPFLWRSTDSVVFLHDCYRRRSVSLSIVSALADTMNPRILRHSGCKFC